ncbi:phosphotransferase family protein [Streptomyces sp. NPDC088801]|uniref:phosphotransferase family protein n=1 Tax=Streptomyces sp. NPDC088801 TaxID=3365903 RepID=UPI00381DCD1B
MTPIRRPLTTTDLAPLARAALGPGRTLTGVERLRGGTKKGVYRLILDDDSTAVAYVWSADEDYWDQPDPDPRDVFSHGTGLGLFTAAHDRLAAAGVRTPCLRFADSTHTHLPADAAVVEDLTGGSLEDALARDPEGAPQAMERMAELLATLHARTGPRFGKAAVIDGGGSSHGVSCEQRVTEGALRCIAEAAARDPHMAAARRGLEEEVLALAAEVRPRDRHTLVHGELGADHVLLTPGGQPALIDIEGLMYFDVEHEHVFLRLRFGPHYDALRAPDLDEARLRLYRLSMHIGLV